MFLWILLMWGSDLPQWRIDNTGMYRNFDRGNIALAPGKIFIMHSQNQTIKAYDRNGVFLHDVAGPGQGPGELFQTNRIIFQNGTLYTVNLDQINTYNEAGIFLKKLVRPNRFGSMMKTTDGWVNLPFFIATPKSSHVRVYGHEFSRAETLFKWDSGYKRSKKGNKNFLKQKVHDQNGIHPAGRFVFLWKDDEEFLLRIFDTQTRTQLEPIPLSLEKGGYVQALMAVPNFTSKPQNEKKGRDGNLVLAPDGLVYWFPAGRPGFALVLDAYGKQYQARFTANQLDRIIAEEGETYYVVYRDPEEEDLCLTRLHKDEAQAFMLAHPLNP